MSLHMKARKLNPDAPEVWGCPRLSEHGAGWLVDWYDASGSIQGVTVCNGDELEWIKGNPDEISKMQAEVKAWLKK